MRLAQAVGAATTRMDQQAIFTGGLPDPKDSTQSRALALNPAELVRAMTLPPAALTPLMAAEHQVQLNTCATCH